MGKNGCSVNQSCPTLCDSVDCSTSGFPLLHHLLELAQTHVHWVSDATQPSDPWSPSSPVLNIPQHQIFLPLSWLFTSGGIRLSKEYSGLIYFRIDWFNLLAVQGTLKSLLHHHSSNTSILWHSAFLMVWLSHSYMTTGKIIALTMWAFVSKVMCLVLKMLSEFVKFFLPRSKHLLISWLQSPTTVILDPKNIKSVTISTFSPSISHGHLMMGCHDLRILNVELQACFFTLLSALPQWLVTSTFLHIYPLITSWNLFMWQPS